VYKIDVDRALIYIKGQTPGKPGAIVRIKDAYKKKFKNEDYLNFPTFVPIEGVLLAKEMIMDPPDQDPEEFWLHDNDVVEPVGGVDEDGDEDEEEVLPDD